jgi:hypothetical protein
VVLSFLFSFYSFFNNGLEYDPFNAMDEDDGKQTKQAQSVDPYESLINRNVRMFCLICVDILRLVFRC